MVLPIRWGRTKKSGKAHPRRHASGRRRLNLEPLEDRRLLAGYEVWAIDQSDTAADGGGTLYIYDGAQLTQGEPSLATPEVIDLGVDARQLCLSQTGTAPQRPHMAMFNHGNTHAVIAFVATGHVLFMETATREPVGCIDVGVQAHAATPAPDDSYVIVANQNGKLLQRIQTDFINNQFTLDPNATLNLATCVTPGGLPCEDAQLRPDNAPICPIIEGTSRFSFVTLRGGGLFVVDNLATPLSIVAEYDRAHVEPNGCGGIEAAGKMFINSGGATSANPLNADLYSFALSDFDSVPNPPNSPTPTVIFSYTGFVDSHGASLVGSGRVLWVADRAADFIVAVDTVTNQEINRIRIKNASTSRPAPDLMDSSPDGKWAFVALRGPNPLTGNVTGVDNAKGVSPGVGILKVRANGRTGDFVGIAPISHVVSGVERADPHGLMVRSVVPHPLSNPNGRVGLPRTPLHFPHLTNAAGGLFGVDNGHISVITGDRSRLLSGAWDHSAYGNAHISGSLSAGFHFGGMIANGLMGPTHSTSQVGGQVAYHKPG